MMHHPSSSGGHNRGTSVPMSTPPSSRLMASGIHHSAAIRNDSVRKRLAEVVKAKTSHNGGKV